MWARTGIHVFGTITAFRCSRSVPMARAPGTETRNLTPPASQSDMPITAAQKREVAERARHCCALQRQAVGSSVMTMRLPMAWA